MTTTPPPEPSPLARSLRDEGVNADLVLIVDDVPDNLAVLHDALDESGYTVLIATNGEQALQRAAQARPDIVLLDAMMPGIDGFEVARRLKADAATAHIPIVFMTGLTETEHLVAALEAGGVDYVTKPIKPKEVLARMNVHLQGARRARQDARQAGQARNALDAFGYASITVRLPEGRLIWQTALARDLLHRYCETRAPETPPAVLEWLLRHTPDARQRGIEPPALSIAQGANSLTLRLHQQTGQDDDGDEWMIIMREVSDTGVIEAMSLSLKLTAREAEVLYWVVKGKTNKDIGEILGSSPATAKKHLERVYVKLGVETRTAAAGVAIKRIRELQPQFEI
ncbi:DNA-binding response OmpR family regulator/DNA-binding CsgD family transcriptional regulator [Variovorax boronicumulans]|jgi:DNA-binding response OmpR family regulator/DNA-binding CsgD family transcriptional regulator|uniref:DNA-binding response OmpR family regulator/DNA-binding CsgD family transcriptional regulator n=2 Tax=Variovorax TaxID=34072 RepID=A0AAW8CPP7_9BURK|nr:MULTISPECIES: response regulator transcription factor [Variovorax]ADU39014.1 two component transcriptional regulator, LuxR family [Variovorax paradoxus EPS]MDP9892270.1 DNA-binding response OmpR family regulator/DNA-binding CsgD family transcriptional regulator [Variovorax boronicumulans]MDP9990289.1 DNA-binding response OmpR family regulator/DNA-binding CsgD family transcriptional regulator [Variovorax boronicumulans]MDQ0001202.1 DNA-binding response OmpR family regulator/DNA-binding CsgD f